MSQRKPSEKLKFQVKERAKNICEYCRSQADFSSQPFAIEHIKPFVLDGKTVLANLAFACQGCNRWRLKLNGKVLGNYTARNFASQTVSIIAENIEAGPIWDQKMPRKNVTT